MVEIADSIVTQVPGRPRQPWLRVALWHGPERLLLPVFILLALLSWDLLVVTGAVSPFLLPRPWAVLDALWSGLAGGDFWPHLLVTGSEALLGFAFATLAGLAVGAAIALSPIVAHAVYPHLVAIQTVPKIALAPLFIVWFGYGEASKVAVAAIISFFPVLANVVAGLRDCDQGKIDVMRSLSASRWQILWLLRLPNALPYVFNGLGIAIVFALTGAIVGEFVGASEGIGYLMVQANAMMNFPTSFALMLSLALLGAVLYGAINLLRRRVVYWAPDDRPNML